MEFEMQPYLDINNDSGVAAYEIGLDIITIQFKDGAIYEYTSISTGRRNLNQMAKLAKAGDGLNSFINTVVKKGYSRKVR